MDLDQALQLPYDMSFQHQIECADQHSFLEELAVGQAVNNRHLAQSLLSKFQAPVASDPSPSEAVNQFII